MLITAVEATVLATVGYDQAYHRLRLEFRSRAIYDYFEVPDAVHQALLDAQPKGNYFNKVIRNRFPVCRIPAWDMGASPVVAGRS